MTDPFGPLAARAYQGERDAHRMADLARQDASGQIHLVDLPYRLSSWAFDDPLNCALWEGQGGELAGWAALQPPFWAIDIALHPRAPESLLPEMLRWADRRASAVRGSGSGRPAWFLNAFDWQQQHARAFEQAGFASQQDVGEDSWSKVLFGRAGQAPPPSAALPDGFTIRPLQGAAEVDAYVALHRAVFQSPNMTAGWRARTLQHPGYRPDLDLVAVDPGGALAGFCIGWLTPHGRGGQPDGQIEPFGVREDVRRLGVGRALLAECLTRMRQLGAAHVGVETDNYRDAAFRFYESVGFAVEQTIIVYRKDYPEGAG